MEKIKGYKTVVFFVLALVVAVANMFGFGDFEFTAEQAKWFSVIVPLAGLLLRAVSDSKIFQKE